MILVHKYESAEFKSEFENLLSPTSFKEKGEKIMYE